MKKLLVNSKSPISLLWNKEYTASFSSFTSFISITNIN